MYFQKPWKYSHGIWYSGLRRGTWFVRPDKYTDAAASAQLHLTLSHSIHLAHPIFSPAVIFLFPSCLIPTFHSDYIFFPTRLCYLRCTFTSRPSVSETHLHHASNCFIPISPTPKHKEWNEFRLQSQCSPSRRLDQDFRSRGEEKDTEPNCPTQLP